MKKIITSLVIILILIFTGCINNSDLITISYDELAKKIENKDTFVLYVGSRDCSHCKQFKPMLEKVINENKLNVYYIDTALLSASKRNAVLKKVDGEGTPTTAYIKNGKTQISPKIDGARDYETIVEFFRDLELIKGE